jgi:NADPH:quinone reductase-like Zn-dependent oxidoreductase
VHVIATEEVDLVGEVMRITNGRGGRVAFDPVGGPGFPKLVSALAFGGIIYIYGLLGTGGTPLPVLEMIAKVSIIKAHNIWLTTGDETRRKAAIEFVTTGLQGGALKPVIDRTFTFDEMADVHRYLEQSGQSGRSRGLSEGPLRQRRHRVGRTGFSPGRWHLVKWRMRPQITRA